MACPVVHDSSLAAKHRLNTIESQLPRRADPSECPPELEERARVALARLESGEAMPGGISRSGPFKKKKMPKGTFRFERGMDLFSVLDKIEDRTKGLDYNIAEHLPGPLRSGRDRTEVLREVSAADGRGENHVFWTEMQRKYCKDGYSSNFVLPIFGFIGGRPPIITQTIILAHHGDCERIARSHVKKQPNFESGLLGTGIIATTDNDHWKQQRDSLVSAFHPIASLAQIYPKVVARAKKCSHKLMALSNGGKDIVDMSEFLLHEALAQLMLGLFGFPEPFMEGVNKRFRDVMAEREHNEEYVRKFLFTLLQMVKDPSHVSPGEAKESGLPVRGPLSRLIDTTTPDEDTLTKTGNAMIFAFAGHDTTGHTMTWLLFELAKNPALQRRLQDEVDGFFARLGGREMAYGDLNELTFMTRCVMETLRLWPAVANGTFRVFEHDDWVHGEGGEKVHVPSGTYVQVTNYLRHRDPKLWGDDAHIFNPDRSFEGKEVWDNRGFAAFNPATPRFSPFTFQPRDCIGKNFAQSEIRAIMSHLLYRFSFELAHPEHASGQQGVNYGTMGPRDMTLPVPEKASFRDRAPGGLWFRIIPREGR
eukprot:Hpha_TRINITY_DN14744_c0_g1::TRINITY_DN14744_c0_g1_i1::g.103168::m.103168/K07440/CYP46A1; cholesterol 24-hydroxylase